MPKGHLLVEMTGQKYGDWTVIGRSEKTNAAGHVFWLVRCACGSERPVAGAQLRNGHSTGCGCSADKRFTERTFVHGMTWKTPTYISWVAMRARCTNPNQKLYSRYGGRGIRFCERWDSFAAFLEDMGPRPDGATLERIDNAGNYEPGNCKWATWSEQHRNKSTNVWIEYNGERMILADWAAQAGLSQGCLRQRLFALGWDMERALTQPPRRTRRKRG